MVRVYIHSNQDWRTVRNAVASALRAYYCQAIDVPIAARCSREGGGTHA